MSAVSLHCSCNRCSGGLPSLACSPSSIPSLVLSFLAFHHFQQKEQLKWSRDRQREINFTRMPKPEDDLETVRTTGLDLISLGLLDANKFPKYELTVEDGRRLAKEYSRVLMRKHRARQKMETTLARMKKEAIAALPENLREKALLPDLTPFPAERFMAKLTPPIEGS